MPIALRRPLIILSLLALALVAAGCSDDSSSPGGQTGDTTAPLVTSIYPEDHDLGVALTQQIYITFSEAMDQATTAANISLGAGTITGLVWDATGTQLTVDHTAWAEGATIDVTVGTGLKDLAGNALPQAFHSGFFTLSSTPTLLEVQMPFDPGAMPTNASPLFLFSEFMNLTSVEANTVITEAKSGAAVPGFSIAALQGDTRRIYLELDAPFDPLTTYTITIGADAQTQGGGTLGTAAQATFTTASGSDTTGPQILTVVPAVGAVVPASQSTIVVTFTEPVQTYDMQPSTMSALLDVFIARDPVWNAAGDEMTVYLQNPLPAGMRLYAVFDQGRFVDLAGNVNAAADSVSFTVAGSPQPLPVRDDLRLYYSTYGYESDAPIRQMVQDISGTNFTRILHQWTGSGYTDLVERWRMSWDGSTLNLRGIFDGDAQVDFTPPIPFLHVPAQTTWSGSATSTIDGQVVTLAYMAESSGPFRENVGSGPMKAPPSSNSYLDLCYEVSIDYSMTAAGAEVPFETGGLNFVFASGLGPLGVEQYGTQYDGGEIVDSWEEGLSLGAAALDDRYERED